MIRYVPATFRYGPLSRGGPVSRKDIPAGVAAHSPLPRARFSLSALARPGAHSSWEESP